MYKLVNLSKYYTSDNKVNKALDNINLEIKENEFVMISGPSGSGKSTLLNVLSGIDSYQDGEMYFEGKETSYYDEKDYETFRYNNISFVFQEYNLIESYTCYQNIEVALIAKKIKYDHETILTYLRKVHLEDKEHIKAAKLSGGQKARLAIARALASNAKILVMDEPTGALDSKSSEEVIEILKELKGSKTIIVVTHNEELFSGIATHHIRIHDGKVSLDKIIEETPLKHTENINETVKTNQVSKLTNLNVKNQPKKTILSFALSFVLTLFVVLIVSTISYSGKSNEGPRNYATSYDRIVINKSEGLNNDDLNKFKNDDALIIEESNLLDHNLILKLNNYREVNAPIINTSLLKSNELKEGRLPTKDDEIVIPYYKNYGNYYDNHENKYVTFAITNLNEYGYERYNYVAKIVGMASTPYYYMNNTKALNQTLNELGDLSYVGKLESFYLSFSYDNDAFYADANSLSSNPMINDKPVNIKEDETMYLKGYRFNPNYYNSFVGSKNYPISILVSNPDNYVKKLDGSYDYYIPNVKIVNADTSRILVCVLSVIMGLIILLLIYLTNIITKQIYKYKNKDNAILNSLGFSLPTIRKSLSHELIINYVLSLIIMIIPIVLDYSLNLFNGFFTANSIWAYLFIILILTLSVIYMSKKIMSNMSENSLFKNLRGGDNNA